MLLARMLFSRGLEHCILMMLFFFIFIQTPMDHLLARMSNQHRTLHSNTNGNQETIYPTDFKSLYIWRVIKLYFMNNFPVEFMWQSQGSPAEKSIRTSILANGVQYGFILQ